MRLDCNIYFLFEKQSLDELLKVIGIQNQLLISFSLALASLKQDIKGWKFYPHTLEFLGFNEPKMIQK